MVDGRQTVDGRCDIEFRRLFQQSYESVKLVKNKFDEDKGGRIHGLKGLMVKVDG